jgi:hypothetical protein
MMRLQEGTAGMYNHPEGGAVFWIELPLAQTAISSEQSAIS